MPQPRAINMDQLQASLNAPPTAPTTDNTTLPPRRELADDMEDDAGDAPTDVNPDVGKLTAASVVQDYTATAERIKHVSEELGAVAQRCEALLHEIYETSRVLDDAAARFLARGKQIAEELTVSANNTAKVREATLDWVNRISETAPS